MIYEFLKVLLWQELVREFDQCNVFNEGLYGVRFIECSSQPELTLFMNFIFSFFAVTSYDKNRLQRHLVIRCK